METQNARIVNLSERYSVLCGPHYTKAVDALRRIDPQEYSNHPKFDYRSREKVFSKNVLRPLSVGETLQELVKLYNRGLESEVKSLLKAPIATSSAVLYGGGTKVFKFQRVSQDLITINLFFGHYKPVMAGDYAQMEGTEINLDKNPYFSDQALSSLVDVTDLLDMTHSQRSFVGMVHNLFPPTIQSGGKPRNVFCVDAEPDPRNHQMYHLRPIIIQPATVFDVARLNARDGSLQEDSHLRLEGQDLIYFLLRR